VDQVLASIRPGRIEARQGDPGRRDPGYTTFARAHWHRDHRMRCTAAWSIPLGWQPSRHANGEVAL